MQRMESYERFVPHAATEVVQVRQLRWEQWQKEAESALLASPGAGGAEAGPRQEFEN